MKVLHIINSLETGGAEKLLLELLPIFHKNNVPVDLLLINGVNSPFLKKLKTQASIQIFSLNRYSLYNPMNIIKIAPLVKNYDLVHAHLFPTLYWVGLVKFIYKTDGVAVLTEHNTSNKRRNKLFFKMTDRFIYRQYNKIITISKGVDASIKQHLKMSKKKYKLIFNGINVKHIIDSKPSSDMELSVENLGSNAKLVIQVSSFTEQKDHKTLIKAIALLPDYVKLILVGEGELKEEYELLVSELNLSERVFFLGIRMDVPELLKRADIVVLSTKFEGLSLSSIEGLASGNPFIGSDVSGLSEVVKNAGILFPQGNEKKLAFNIEKLLSDSVYYNSTRKLCIERAKLYDIKYMADQYISLYEELLFKKKK